MPDDHLRYVAHFDMLGMARLSLKKPDAAWSAICNLARAKEESLNLVIEITSTKTLIRDRIKSITFSDTIIVFTLRDEVEDLYAIIILCTQLFADALKYNIPLRGGISHGIFFVNFDHNLYAGPALVNAYNIGEYAQWLGIMVDETVAERCRAIPLMSGTKDAILNWPVPLKTGSTRTSHVINWPYPMRNNFTVSPPISIDQFYKGFAPLFGSFSDLGDNEKEKYRNTVDFINFCLK